MKKLISSKKVLTPLGKLLKEMKEAVKDAEKEKQDMDAISWGYQDGYLLSFNDVKGLLIYIDNLKMASGRK